MCYTPGDLGVDGDEDGVSYGSYRWDTGRMMLQNSGGAVRLLLGSVAAAKARISQMVGDNVGARVRPQFVRRSCSGSVEGIQGCVAVWPNSVPGGQHRQTSTDQAVQAGLPGSHTQ